MIPLISFLSFVGSAAATKAVLNKVRPIKPRPLSQCDDVGYVDPQTGEWHSLMPTTPGHFAEDGTFVPTL